MWSPRRLPRITSIEDLPLTAGGWRDSTRIAAGDPELWTQILFAQSRQCLEVAREVGKVAGCLPLGDSSGRVRGGY